MRRKNRKYRFWSKWGSIW